ncbi:membrane-spanning 4-domains subfamily A member 8-like isoform X1 [Actinia tenebrosa]|uniref:Membrane-spanning 4-domains subfamily A member 8-like isoform X1 n=1 Tax=Actinia tenebrosa TaxID=6105 RepID=A0A6P8I2B9_ACTTE|nr:membrane-spanning 4-domains subfamily A member 8-like isoform X1 [Actinia tenebrosa]
MGADSYQITLISGITQLIIGVLCFLFGIADIATTIAERRITASLISAIPIWGGIWICVTGIIGICAVRRARFGRSGCICCDNGSPEVYTTQGNCCASLKCMIGVYMGLSITASVIAALMIMCYALTLSWHADRSTKYAFVYIAWIMMFLSIGAFGVAIWASVCCCKIICCGQNPQSAPVGPVVYTQTQGPPVAYIIVQGPNGTPVAIPAQTSGPMMEPGGTPENNPVEQAAVPPHYNFGAQGLQANENSVKVAL